MDQPTDHYHDPLTDRHWILDSDGEPRPATLLEWARWVEADPARRQVALTRVYPYRVSTVFLGMDLAYGLGAPLLYETAVFHGRAPDWVSIAGRYPTRRAAMVGHRRAVRWARIRRLRHWW